MAQQDLAGLLTGITQAPIDPMAGASMAQRQLAFGAEAGRNMRQGIGGLFNTDTRTTKEKADQMMAKLDVTKKADRDQMLKIVGNVNPQAVPALRTRFAQMDAASVKQDSLASATQDAIKKKYGKDRSDLLELASQGMSLKDIDAFAETDVEGKYKVVGNNVLDITTGKYLPPPPNVGKGGYTVSKVYDPVRGVNVIKYLDKDDPSIVLDERLDAVDVGKQSATLLDLQSKNLTAANNAGTEYREAVSVGNRLEKAAAGGVTGGIVATGEEFIKSILGTEDEVTLLRKAADRLRVSRGVANLPTGPASDKDVALVMEGELSATANPKTVASYVRGIAKLAKAEKQFFTDQNGWLDRYKDIGGFSSYLLKEQLEEQLGHSDIIAAVEKLAAVNYDPAALAIFEEKFGFNYADAKEELGRANETLSQLKREGF
jgi:hypothetical protein